MNLSSVSVTLSHQTLPQERRGTTLQQGELHVIPRTCFLFLSPPLNRRTSFPLFPRQEPDVILEVDTVLIESWD